MKPALGIDYLVLMYLSICVFVFSVNRICWAEEASEKMRRDKKAALA